MKLTKEHLTKIVVIVFSLLADGPVWANDFAFSPEPDGTINLFGSLDWVYPVLEWEGSASLSTKNQTQVEDSPPEPGLEQSMATIHRQISTQVRPVEFLWPMLGGSSLAGIEIDMDWLFIRETGFTEFSTDDVAVPVARIFFDNDRKIFAIKPGVSWTLRWKQQNWSLGASVRYSPIVWIDLQQQLMTSSNIAELSMEKTPFHYSGQSSNAWGTSMKGSWAGGGIRLHSQTQWEGTLYDYEYQSIGSTAHQKAWIVDGRTDVFFALDWKFLEFGGWIPKIGIGYDWSGTWDQDTATTQPFSSETKWRLNLGLDSSK